MHELRWADNGQQPIKGGRMRALLRYTLLLLLITNATAQRDVVASEEIPIRAEGNGFTFALSPRATYHGIVDDQSGPGDDVRSWSGHLDHNGGEFTVIEYEKRRFARVHVPGRTFEILPAKAGTGLIVKEFEESKLPAKCAVGQPVQVASLMPPGMTVPPCDAADTAMLDSIESSAAACLTNPIYKPVRIDAMVAYTQAVEDDYGRSGVVATTLLSISETNTAFKLSKVTATLRLATPLRTDRPRTCIVKVDYNETGDFAKDLDALLFQGDGLLDDVRSIRDSCRADVVELLINKSDGKYGKACVMKHLSRAYGDYAMGVVYAPSASAHYSFTHELGHMMGGGHEGTTVTGMCADSHGRLFTNGAEQISTMMYTDPLHRTLYFSGPAIHYDATSLFTGAADANNARTLRVSAMTVSKFKP
jgi:hypothetical protein